MMMLAALETDTDLQLQGIDVYNCKEMGDRFHDSLEEGTAVSGIPVSGLSSD